MTDWNFATCWEALADAPGHTTLDACGDAWRESARRVDSGELAKDDAVRLQGVLRKRMEELKGAARTALDAEDPWAEKVSDISDVTEGEAALAEALQLLSSGEIDDDRYRRIEAAIEARGVASLQPLLDSVGKVSDKAELTRLLGVSEMIRHRDLDE